MPTDPDAPANEPSLYEQLGGEHAIEAAAGLFYEKVLADPLTAPFFEKLDMPAQVRKQISFMAHLNHRFALILERAVEFCAGGELIERQTAMKLLRTSRK